MFHILPKISPSDNELLETAQGELKKLQRQYRIMENGKKSYAAEMKCYLNKQRQMIRTFEKERKPLKMKVDTMKFSEDIACNTENNKEILKLAEKYDKYNLLIKQEKETLLKLNLRIVEIEKFTIRGIDSGSLTKLDETTYKACKHAEMIQNRLHNATVKYNKILSENTNLRKEVNKLLQDRAQFNSLYKKLATKLNTLKKMSLDLVDQATTACDQREEVELKLKEITEKDEHDVITHSHEMRELQRKLHHLQKLQEFFFIKSQKRIMADLEQKETEKKQEKLREEKEIIERDINILEQIKRFIGESEIDKLSAVFVKQEEENFALFNYVNEINNEVEILQGEVKKLCITLDEQNLINEVQKMTQLETAENLHKQLQEQKDTNCRERKKLDDAANMVKLLFNGIEDLFKTTKCSSLYILQLLDDDGVSGDNVHLFLDIIAKKVEEFQNFLSI